MLIAEIAYRPIDNWPGKLTTARRTSPFRTTHSATLDLLKYELGRLGARKVVLQLALREAEIRRDGLPRMGARPLHPGVILSFETRDAPLSFPCDTFGHWHDNLRAIALALECLRRVDRYGVTKGGEQYRGWKRLAAPTAQMSWDEAADFMSDETEWCAGDMGRKDLRRLSYLTRAQVLHPDKEHGDAEAFKRLQHARARLEQED